MRTLKRDQNMVIRLKVNPTELLVLKVITSYHSNEVPQLVFKNMENSTVKKALRSLTKNGLIYKIPNLKDMRQRYVCLTELCLEKIDSNEINI